MSGINLVPKIRIESRERRIRTRFWISVGIAYTIVVASVSGAGYSYRQDDQARVCKAIDDTEASARKESQRLEDAIAQLKQAEAKLNLLREIGDQPDWSLLLDYLARIKGDRVVLRGVRVDPLEAHDPKSKETAANSTRTQDVYVLELDGAGLAPTDVTGFVLKLEKSGIFQRVTLNGTSRSMVQNTSASTFTITCELRG